MKFKIIFGKKNIKRVILVFIFLVIVLLCSSKTYASTIDSSNMSINIDITGKCYVEEKLYITAIDDPSDYSTKYFGDNSYIQLKRGSNIEKLCINNIDISKNDIDKYYNDYVGLIKLSYPQTRKI